MNITSEKDRIRVYQLPALKEAFLAGQLSAKGDPSNWRDIFNAGVKKGSAFLNESVNAPGLMELLAKDREVSPGSWSSWIRMNKTRLSAAVKRDEFNVIATKVELQDRSGMKLITLGAIEDVIVSTFNNTLDSLRYGTGRFSHVKKPRYFAFYLAYFHSHTPLIEIGRRWGGKDHATVIHGAKQVANNAKLYEKDMAILNLLYKRLAHRGYDINHFVQDNKVRSRTGAQRLSIEPIKINL